MSWEDNIVNLTPGDVESDIPDIQSTLMNSASKPVMASPAAVAATAASALAVAQQKMAGAASVPPPNLDVETVPRTIKVRTTQTALPIPHEWAYSKRNPSDPSRSCLTPFL